MVKITRTFSAFLNERDEKDVKFLLNIGLRFNCTIFSKNKKLITKLSKLTGRTIYMKSNGGIKNVRIQKSR